MASPAETIRRLYADFARGDVPAVLACLVPDVHWTEAKGFPYGGTFIGPDAVLQQVFARLGTEWHQFTAVPNEFVADGDTVVALGNYSGTYKGTGKSFTAPFVHVWKFRGAKVARFQQHTDTVLVQAAMR